MRLKQLFVVGLICAAGASCSSGSGSASTYNYSGPGSDYDATLNSDGSFTITESTAGLTINGTYATLSSGFLLLTVGSASGTGAPSAGSQAVALNVPGFVFLLKPLSDGSPIIPMIPSGSCPSSDTSLNWILTQTGGNVASSAQEAFGTFTYTASSGAVALPTKFALDNTSQGAGTIGTFTCSSGVGTLSGGETMYFNPSGGAIVKGSGAGSDIILAMAQSSVSSLSNLNGSYAGLVFSNNGGGDDVIPVIGSLSSGTGTFTEVTDVATGTTSSNAATLTLSNPDTPSAGFVDANLSISGDATNPAQCMVTLNANSSGKDIIMCIGEEPGNNSGANNVYTLLLVQT